MVAERVVSSMVELEAASLPEVNDDDSDNLLESSDDFKRSDTESRNSDGGNMSHDGIASRGVSGQATKRWRRRKASHDRVTVKEAVGHQHLAKDVSSLIDKWQAKYPDRKIVPHACSICGKQFLQAVQLRKHMINHAEEESSSMSADLSSMPPLEFPYSCYVCRRHFLFANDLRRHLVSHSDERPHSCVVCKRAFKREDDLAKHMKTHRDVRPYECEACGEGLETATKLRKHIRRVHGNKYVCTACGQYFTKRSAMSRHKREHHAGLLLSFIDLLCK
jgi:predicted SprT family Zn-dependent metalloprotease